MGRSKNKTTPSVKGNWYVVATQARRESTAQANLEKQRYRVFCPRICLKKRQRGKWQEVVEPLFPGYVFVELLLGRDDPAPIRSTIGCIGLIRSGSEPSIVPKIVMSGLLALGSKPKKLDSVFESGEKVRFEAGPFRGLHGVYQMANGRDRVKVLISLLGRDNLVLTSPDNLSSDL